MQAQRIEPEIDQYGRQTFYVETGSPEWHALRAKDITSTEAAALLGISPYMTPFELFHRKARALPVEIEPNERMKWGTRLQDAIAAGIAQDYGLKIRRMDEYIRLPGERLGSSYDFMIVGTTPDSPYAAMFAEHGAGVLEIKNVDSLAYRDGWIEQDDVLEAPPQIEAQVQQQLYVSRFHWALIGALVGGNNPKVILRTRDERVIELMTRKAAEFWKAVEDGNAPRPDFTNDVEFLATIYGYAEPGKIADKRGDQEFRLLVAGYDNASELEKKAKAEKDAYKARMLEQIGDAEKVVLDDGSLSCGLIGPAHVEYDREGYRNFRRNTKGKKKAAATDSVSTSDQTKGGNEQ